ncbi:MAG: glycosyltransferase family 9 protein [Desulfovibrionaceae bacterium]|nr:glycosyltransferase family 9 protein [Desulfovibrionaceae bacterium]
MADVLIVNLTRFGDLLQSQPLIHDLHDSGYSVGLICLDNFAPALPLLRHVEAAWALPGGKLLAGLEKDWSGAAAQVLQFAHTIRQEARPRYILNLTATLSGRLLARLLAPSPEAILGFGMDADGFGFNENVWCSFFSGALSQRMNAPFNLVDMFRMTGARLMAPGMTARPGQNRLCEPSPAALEQAGALLAEGGACQGYVALQLGASEARRQWPVARFAALGDRLYREAGLCPVLLGVRSEEPLARAYADAATEPFVSAVGRTGIPQLAALLRKSRLLITNDTGTMHLAAGLGVPCLAFFLATAQPWDTGPYLPGCCCLEPAMPCHPCAYGSSCPSGNACLERIGADPVTDMVLGWLRTGNWQDSVPTELARQARVWLTSTDSRGFARVRSLSGHEAEERSLWLEQQRIFWRQILDESLTVAPLPPCPEALRKRVLPVLGQASRLLEMLAEQGRLVGRNAQAGQLFLRNCERLQIVLEACPPLFSLGFFWRELRQERGGQMDELLAFIGQLSSHLRRWAAALEENAGS